VLCAFEVSCATVFIFICTLRYVRVCRAPDAHLTRASCGCCGAGRERAQGVRAQPGALHGRPTAADTAGAGTAVLRCVALTQTLAAPRVRAHRSRLLLPR
jgi:hypothetical protein